MRDGHEMDLALRMGAQGVVYEQVCALYNALRQEPSAENKAQSHFLDVNEEVKQMIQEEAAALVASEMQNSASKFATETPIERDMSSESSESEEKAAHAKVTTLELGELKRLKLLLMKTKTSASLSTEEIASLNTDVLRVTGTTGDSELDHLLAAHRGSLTF